MSLQVTINGNLVQITRCSADDRVTVMIEADEAEANNLIAGMSGALEQIAKARIREQQETAMRGFNALVAEAKFSAACRGAQA